MPKRLSVVISQGQSHNPVKRKLEEDVVTALLFENGIDVMVVPHLYDLTADGTGALALQGITNDVVVISWLYERAARWILGRNKMLGQEGIVHLKASDELPDEDDEEDTAELDAAAEGAGEKNRVVEVLEIPPRQIFCLNFRASQSADDLVAEVRRIASTINTQVVGLTDWVQGSPKPEQMARFENPTNDTAMGPLSLVGATATVVGKSAGESATVNRVEEDPSRRWYPVIDFSRCTNCMECIDFCLFGVYGVDAIDTILVEQPDNCRKGCPACSRVCPENAIMFPQHKSPAIAGAPAELGGLKIDLSKLFGAPQGDANAVEIAARERDEQLMMVGREAVGMSVGMPKRQMEKAGDRKDSLDDLIDELDDLDL